MNEQKEWKDEGNLREKAVEEAKNLEEVKKWKK